MPEKTERRRTGTSQRAGQTPGRREGGRSPVEIARRLFWERRLRDTLFADVQFAEPAWDLLLELYVARAEKTEMPTTRACVAASVPATTALRWIVQLEERGLLCRRRSQRDERLSLVELTDQAFATMSDYLPEIDRLPR